MVISIINESLTKVQKWKLTLCHILHMLDKLGKYIQYIYFFKLLFIPNQLIFVNGCIWVSSAIYWEFEISSVDFFLISLKDLCITEHHVLFHFADDLIQNFLLLNLLGLLEKGLLQRSQSSLFKLAIPSMTCIVTAHVYTAQIFYIGLCCKIAFIKSIQHSMAEIH